MTKLGVMYYDLLNQVNPLLGSPSKAIHTIEKRTHYTKFIIVHKNTRLLGYTQLESSTATAVLTQTFPLSIITDSL